MNVNRITAMLMLSSATYLASASFVANANSYAVQELPTNNLSFNQFGSSIDNTGLMLTIINQPFNPPIDLSLIDLDDFNLSDPEAAAQGNFNAADLATVASLLISRTQEQSVLSQKLANFIAYQTDGTDFQYVYGFDSQTEATDGYTFSLSTLLGDSVNGTHIVGTMQDPFSVINYTNENGDEFDFVVNSFNSRGFVQVGDQVTPLPAPELTGGGISEANAINDNLMVAGIASVAVTETLQGEIDECSDDETRGDIPVEVCLYLVLNNTSTNQFTGQTIRTYDSRVTTRATTWQLDNSGNVLERVTYGLNFEPEADETRILSSQAVSINNQNEAVGTSIVSVDGNLTQAASLFADGVTTRLLSDNDLLPNVAVGINDARYVVGARLQLFNNVQREKLFVYNMNTDEVVFPTDFFVSASSTPRAINNNNLVVGDGEVDASSSSRPRNGFLYDIEANTFTNLNDLLSCDSPYTIIAGNDINDNNEIIADALVEKPRRNFKGEILLNDAGEQTFLDVVVAVKLVPTGNAPSQCDVSEEELASIERQGASLGILTMFGLFVISIIRRFKKTT